MRSDLFKLALVVSLLAPGALAQTSTPTPQQTPRPPAPSSSPRADDGEPSVERLRAHVAFLASDKLEGRKTGTDGAEAAAAYVAREFAAAGLKTAPPTPSGHREGRLDMGYLRTFPYVAGVEAGPSNAFTFTRREGGRDATLDLRLNEDWTPLGFTANGAVENAEAVFVGHGIVASEAMYDDYAGADAKGKVAVALAGVPGGDNPHNPIARYNELRLKASAARDRGARALVLVAREEKFADERLARLRYDNSGDAGLPVAVVSRAAARRILEAGGVSLDEFERRVRSAPPAASVAPANNPSPHGGGASAHPKFAAPLRNVSLTLKTDVTRRTVAGFNVVGVLEGSDAKLKEEVVVLGAHYDHLGRGGAGSLAPREGDIHHGADDNASGTAALVELARLLARERPRRTHLFVAFGGEEEGLLGSSYYVNHPAFPLERTVAMLNMDMVGRMKDNRLFVGGVGTAAEWRALLAQANATLKMRVTAGASSPSAGEIPVVRGANGETVATAAPRERFALALGEDGYGPSDHSSFYARKIPVLFFFTGTHEDYHKPSDTAERINYDSQARLVGFVRDIVLAVDRNDRRPAYAAAASPNAGRAATGFRVYLGTVPSYADSTDGLKLDAVRDHSPAALAGLRAGDRITRLAGRDIRNVYDYTYALSEMEADREYEVEFVRDGKAEKVKIRPAARR